MRGARAAASAASFASRVASSFASSWAVVAAFALFGGAAPSFAQDSATGDIALRPGERVRVILASGERRAVAVAGIAGGRYTMTAVPVGKSPVVPTLALRDPSGASVDISSLVKNVGRGKGAKSLAFGTTGIWRLAVATPDGKPGEVEISVAAKLPKPPRVTGTTAGDPASVEIPFAALPGASCDVAVKLAAKPAVPVTLALRGPDDGDLATADGAANAASVKKVVTTALGEHRIVIVGGPAKFTGSLKVKAPKARRGLAFDLVEALPIVTTFGPTTTTDDVNRSIVASGYGFETGQTLLLREGGATKKTTPLSPLSGTLAQAAFNFDDMPAGTYDLLVALRGGRTVIVPGTFTVTDFQGRVKTIVPAVAPNSAAFDVTMDCDGIDATAALDLRRGDGATFAVLSTTRTNPRTWSARITPPAFTTGLFEVRVLEDLTLGPATPGGLDIIGRKHAEATVRTGAVSLLPTGAAGDAAGGRIGVAYIDAGTAVFALLDASDWSVVSTYTAPRDANATHRAARIAFHPTERTWAFTWTQRRDSGVTGAPFDEAWTGVAARTDFTSPSGVSGPWLTRAAIDVTEAAADTLNGGWRHLWTERLSSSAGAIRWAPVSSAGVVDVGSATSLASDAQGFLGSPGIVVRGDGLHVMTYLALDGAFYGVYRAVVGGNGQEPTPRTLAVPGATVPTISTAHVALDPLDDTVAVAFTFASGTTLKPGFVLLSGADLLPSAAQTNSVPGEAPVGRVTAFAWNPEREQFVAALAQTDDRVVLRRVKRDVTIEVAHILEAYETPAAVIASTATDMTLIRATDDNADGVYDPTIGKHEIRAFRGR